MKLKIVIVLLILVYLSKQQQQNINKQQTKQNITLQQKLQQQKNRAEKGHEEIIIHLVPHSHDDLGWTRTIDQYWIERVMGVYNSIPQTVQKGNNRTFTIDGIDFLMMWWKKQNEETKQEIREMFKQGRLEIVNGGWSEHDEGAAYYSDMISNMQFGQLQILKELDFIPKVGWQIDVFGMSATNARLFSEMGLHSVFINRVDVHERQIRRKNMELEFVWRPYSHFSGKDAQILGNLFWHHYSVPELFEIQVLKDQIVGVPLNTEEEWDSFIDKLDWWLNMSAEKSLSNHLLFPAGDDFLYHKNAEQIFTDLENIMNRLVKKYPRYKWHYSTPTHYMKALADEKIVFPVKYDEAMPFCDSPDKGAYWVGYFTSRPNLKSQMKQITYSNYVLNKLYSQMLNKDEKLWQNLVNDVMYSRDQLMDAVGMTIHHDAITGTCRQDVANDYAFRVHKALRESYDVIAEFFKLQMKRDIGLQTRTFLFCDRYNGTYLDCPVGKNLGLNVWIVAAFNPSLKAKPFIKIKLPHPHWHLEVWSFEKKQWIRIRAEAICEMNRLETFERIQNCETYIETYHESNELKYLRIIYDDAFDIRIQEDEAPKFEGIYNVNINLQIENTEDGVQFVQRKKDGFEETFIFDVRYYVSQTQPLSKVQNTMAASGMYQFVANMSDNFGMSHRYCELQDYQIFKGDLLSQITMHFRGEAGNYVTAKARLFNVGDFYDMIFWDVDIHGANTREVSNEITVNFRAINLNNKQVFWTDSNGLKMMRKAFDDRDSFTLRTPQKTSSNYFPVTSAITIYDDLTNLQMTVITDRSMGGTSLRDGMVELMVHRRIEGDDQKGVGEELLEKTPEGRPIHVHSEFGFQLFNRKKEKSLQRQYQIHQDEPQVVGYSIDLDSLDINDTFVRPKAYANFLPQEVIQSLGFTDTMKVYIFPLDRNLYTIRLENINDKFDNPKVDPKTAPQINLKQLALQLFKLTNNEIHYRDNSIDIEIIELTLSGNQSLDDLKKSKQDYSWIGVDDDKEKFKEYLKDTIRDRYVVEHMRLRTFLVEIKPILIKS